VPNKCCTRANENRVALEIESSPYATQNQVARRILRIRREHVCADDRAPGVSGIALELRTLIGPRSAAR